MGDVFNIIAQFISQVGFPIFVAVWMLYKTSEDNEKINVALTNLKNAITELSTLMKDRMNKNE